VIENLKIVMPLDNEMHWCTTVPWNITV